MVDEGQDTILQFLFGPEAASAHHFSWEDAKPALDLVQPGAMLRGIDETNPGRVGQERRSASEAFEDPTVAFLDEFQFGRAVCGYEPDQRLGFVGVEVVEHDNDGSWEQENCSSECNPGG